MTTDATHFRLRIPEDLKQQVEQGARSRRRSINAEIVARLKGEAAAHPLVGAGLHFKDENGAVENRASILAIVPSNGPAGDLALIQYYDWIIGYASTRRLIALSELAGSDRWVFYASVEEMNDHYERVDSHRNEHIRGALQKGKDAAPPKRARAQAADSTGTELPPSGRANIAATPKVRSVRNR